MNGLRNFLRNALLTGNANSKVELDPKEWFLRTSARIDLLREVENTVADDVRAASQADRVQRQPPGPALYGHPDPGALC